MTTTKIIKKKCAIVFENKKVQKIKFQCRFGGTVPGPKSTLKFMKILWEVGYLSKSLPLKFEQISISRKIRKNLRLGCGQK